MSIRYQDFSSSRFCSRFAVDLQISPPKPMRVFSVIEAREIFQTRSLQILKEHFLEVALCLAKPKMIQELKNPNRSWNVTVLFQVDAQSSLLVSKIFQKESIYLDSMFSGFIKKEVDRCEIHFQSKIIIKTTAATEEAIFSVKDELVENEYPTKRTRFSHHLFNDAAFSCSNEEKKSPSKSSIIALVPFKRS